MFLHLAKNIYLLQIRANALLLDVNSILKEVTDAAKRDNTIAKIFEDLFILISTIVLFIILLIVIFKISRNKK